MVKKAKQRVNLKEVPRLNMTDVENFMGIPAEDFVSQNAEKIHPSYRKFDVLRTVVTTALLLQYYGEQEEDHHHHQENKKKALKKLEYCSKNRIPNTTSPQQLRLKTERLLQQKRGVKRSLQFNDEDDDDDDDDYQEEENNRFKKTTKRTNGGGGNKRRDSGLGSDQHALVALPPEVEKLIQKSGPDEEPVLVIRKELEKSDLNGHENRMSVPARKARGFLTDEEEEKVNSRKPDGSKEFIEVPIIMPSLNRGVIKLRKWDMAKNTGTASASYMLTGDWKRLIEPEGFKPKTEVQLWAYRVNRKLHFALVKLGNPKPNPNGGSSTIASTSTHSS